MAVDSMLRKVSCPALAVTLLFGIWGVTAARADNPKLNVDDFAPSPHAGDILDILATRVPGHLDYSGGAWFAYRQAPLVARGFEGEGEVELVSDQLVGDLQFALPLLGVASIGVNLPVLLYSSGDDPATVNPEWSQVSGAGLGDLRLSAKVRFWGGGNGLGLGAAQDITLPTSVGDKLLGAEMPGGLTRLIFDYGCGGFVLALNAGYLVRKAATEFVPSVGDELVIAGGVKIPISGSGLELLLSNQTRTLVDDPFSGERATANSTRGGLRIRPFSNLVVTAAGSAGFGSLAGSAAWEGILQIGWETPLGDEE